LGVLAYVRADRTPVHAHLGAFARIGDNIVFATIATRPRWRT